MTHMTYFDSGFYTKHIGLAQLMCVNLLIRISLEQPQIHMILACYEYLSK